MEKESSHSMDGTSTFIALFPIFTKLELSVSEKFVMLYLVFGNCNFLKTANGTAKHSLEIVCTKVCVRDETQCVRG